MIDNKLKQRLIGATVLIALVVVIIPMVLDGGHERSSNAETNIPPKPDVAFESKITPLDEPLPMVQPSSSSSVPSVAPPAQVQEHAVSPPVALAAPAQPEAAATPAPPADADAKPPAAPAAVAAPPANPIASASKPKEQPPTAKSRERMAVGAWVVQLGSFSNEQNALKLRDRLRAKGYTAFVEPVQGSGGKSLRVRVGPELERAQAEAIRDKLQKELKIKGIVGRYPS